MTSSPARITLALLFVFIGFFGVAFAVAGVLIPLPVPAAGGTCGPSTASEAPITAFFDPGSIGAGPEPKPSDLAGRQQWTAFVSDCQSSTDHRVGAATVILAASLAVGIVGPMLVLRKKRKGGPPVWSPYPGATPATGFTGPVVPAVPAGAAGPYDTWSRSLPEG